MKTFERIGGVVVAVLMVAGVAQASSSVNGAPGRSDFNKRRSARSWKTAKPGEVVLRPQSDLATDGTQSFATEKSEALTTTAIAPVTERVVLPTGNSMNEISPLENASMQAPLSSQADQAAAKVVDATLEPAIVSTLPVVVIAEKSELAPEARMEVETAKSEPAPVVAVAVVPARQLSYAEVLTEHQKEVLKGRAEDLKLKEDDYDHLLSPEEKERLDAVIRERMNAMASGE